MDREQIREVMRDVFGRNFYMKDIGGWVSMKCPLSPWTHERGQDGSPSAGVSINDADQSFFNCFTCKHTGPLSKMLSSYAEFSGEDLGDLIDEIEEGEFLGPREATGYDTILQNRMVEMAMPIDEGIYMDLYESAADHYYVRDRGVSRETAKRLELLYDPKDPADKEPRILFPVRGPDGLLYGFSGRATRPTAALKVRDYHGLHKAQCLLGSHLAVDAPRIALVEGLFDYAVMQEMGECGCAVMHSTLTEFQAEIVRTLGKPTFLMYDNDKAGHDGTALAIPQLRRHVPLFTTKYPKVRIEDRSEQGWHWLKDPGELEDAELADMLAKAVIV